MPEGLSFYLYEDRHRALFTGLGVDLHRACIQMPESLNLPGGGGPVIPGKLFPFMFITIACGAISGFHSLIAFRHNA